jgi:hypothetical protein
LTSATFQDNIRFMKIKKGQYFLLPFNDKRMNLLVRAVRHAVHCPEAMWDVLHVKKGYESTCLLSSCNRCSPSEAKRIMGGKE